MPAVDKADSYNMPRARVLRPLAYNVARKNVARGKKKCLLKTVENIGFLHIQAKGTVANKNVILRFTETL